MTCYFRLFIEELSTSKEETENEVTKVKELDAMNRRLEIEWDKLNAALEVSIEASELNN